MPPRTHKCKKEKELTDLTVKSNKTYDAIYGNGDGQPGMKINVALLAQQMVQVINTLTPMGTDVTEIKEFITKCKAVHEEGEKNAGNKNRTVNTIINLVIGCAAVVAIIISIKALNAG